MNFSAIKEKMDTVFSRILTSAQAGEMPSAEDTSTLSRLAKQMQSQADEEWGYECDDFCRLVDSLHQACSKNQLQDAIRLAESIDDSKSYCHRTFAS